MSGPDLARSSTFQVRGRGNFQLVQQESFAVCIRNNVREYGGGDICLREQLANADDARATRFTVCFDKSTYSAQDLLSDAMYDLQGAALIVENDAEFSSEDLRNFTLKVGSSAKANDSHTTGKFGKGALTAYSLTDTIQLLSGNQLLILDPHQTRLPETLPSLACNLVNENDQSYLDLAKEAPGQLEPFVSFTKSCYGVCNFAPGTHYPGTLFRLALRTKSAAELSQISKDSINTDQFAKAIKDFMHSAPDLLLFMRSVKQISIYVKDSATSPAVLLHESSATCQEVPQLLSDKVQVQKLTVATQSAKGHNTKKMWSKAVNTGQHIAGMGIATLLHSDEHSGQRLPVLNGRVFSTMILPFQNTGLPVHINGAFRMSSDRRKLWEGEGDRGQGEQNVEVLQQQIAPAWAVGLAHICNSQYSNLGPQLYRLWPSDKPLQPKLLDSVATALVHCILASDLKVFWLPRHDSRTKAPGSWVSAADACFLPFSSDTELDVRVVNVARRAGLQIPEMPKHVAQMVKNAAAASPYLKLLCIFCPTRLRGALRKAGNIVKPAEIEPVLEYAASDGRYSDLDDLHLVLLRSGKVGRLGHGKAAMRKTYYMPNPGQTHRIYDLMPNWYQQIEESPTWKIMAERKVDDAFVLDKSHLNVKVPSFADLVENLPGGWKGNICDHDKRKGVAHNLHPDSTWLDKFWAVVHDSGNFPSELASYMVVPLSMPNKPSKMRLASVQYCQRRCAIKTSHLQGVPPNAADILAAVGCLCILKPEADCASPIAEADPPFTTALSAASAHLGIPLSELVSEKLRFSGSSFPEVRQFLTDHVHADSAQQANVWSVIRQCSIFEAASQDSKLTHLSHHTDIILLPNPDWEAYLADLDQLLPDRFAVYHTGSDTQRKLLKLSGIEPAELPQFISNTLLPAIEAQADAKWEPLVFKALTELAAHPDTPFTITKLYIRDSWQDITRLVDSSSKTMRLLFGSPDAWEGAPSVDYQMLPDSYTSDILKVLQQQGLGHESSADIYFFKACSAQFTSKQPQMTKDEMTTTSLALVKMLQCCETVYSSTRGHSLTDDTASRDVLQSAPVFLTAELPFPYNVLPYKPLVSLKDSEDHARYRLVANDKPVTSNLHGDTMPLRRSLGLPSEVFVASLNSLLTIAANEQILSVLQSQNHPLQASLREDIQNIYELIIGAAAAAVSADGTPSAILHTWNAWMTGNPWILVQKRKFVCTNQLYFDIDTDSESGYQVPSWLLKFFEQKPSLKQWMVKHLGIIDLQSKAPPVKQLHPNPVTAETTLADYFAGAFNNPSMYTNAIVEVGNQVIHIHKVVIAQACKTLAVQWEPLWAGSHNAMVLDVYCEATGRRISYAGALVFFQFLYTGAIAWPEGEPDADSAFELLVLASMYDVPFLVCAAEMVIRPAVDFENCCSIFAFADHYHADQLRSFCLHFIKAGHRHVKVMPDYQNLSDDLRQEVEQRLTSIGQ